MLPKNTIFVMVFAFAKAKHPLFKEYSLTLKGLNHLKARRYEHQEFYGPSRQARKRTTF